MTKYNYGNFTEKFLDDLAKTLSGKRVLEIFAGNGYLASALIQRNVRITPTSILSTMDGHEIKLYTPVEELEASAAIAKYGNESDVLLMSWPTTTKAAFHAACRWGILYPDKPLVYIGEMPNDKVPGGNYPGCATDEFFLVIGSRTDITSYTPRNSLDRACILMLDRAKISSQIFV